MKKIFFHEIMKLKKLNYFFSFKKSFFSSKKKKNYYAKTTSLNVHAKTTFKFFNFFIHKQQTHRRHDDDVD